MVILHAVHLEYIPYLEGSVLFSTHDNFIWFDLKGAIKLAPFAQIDKQTKLVPSTPYSLLKNSTTSAEAYLHDDCRALSRKPSQPH